MSTLRSRASASLSLVALLALAAPAAQALKSDADQPLEIFRRLLVGSEGTLGFVAEAVFETVPLPARTTASGPSSSTFVTSSTSRPAGFTTIEALLDASGKAPSANRALTRSRAWPLMRSITSDSSV